MGAVREERAGGGLDALVCPRRSPFESVDGGGDAECGGRDALRLTPMRRSVDSVAGWARWAGAGAAPPEARGQARRRRPPAAAQSPATRRHPIACRASSPSPMSYPPRPPRRRRLQSQRGRPPPSTAAVPSGVRCPRRRRTECSPRGSSHRPRRRHLRSTRRPTGRPRVQVDLTHVGDELAVEQTQGALPFQRTPPAWLAMFSSKSTFCNGPTPRARRPPPVPCAAASSGLVDRRLRLSSSMFESSQKMPPPSTVPAAVSVVSSSLTPRRCWTRRRSRDGGARAA